MNEKTADSLIKSALKKALELEVNVCIAVVDDGAILKAFHRMDGAFKGSVDVAIGKAKTSALFPLPTEDFGQLIRQENLTGMELSNNGLMGFAGGHPIMQQGTQHGAIGISGGSAEQDNEIALFALSSLD